MLEDLIALTATAQNDYLASIGNLCSCTQSMDSNVFIDLVDTAIQGQYLTIVERCGDQSDACPAAANSGGFLPSGMYAALYSCPDNPCDTSGYERVEVCPAYFTGGSRE